MSLFWGGLLCGGVGGFWGYYYEGGGLVGLGSRGQGLFSIGRKLQVYGFIFGGRKGLILEGVFRSRFGELLFMKGEGLLPEFYGIYCVH